jgi:DNA-binding FadR family transcriptional regulator
MSGHAFPTDSPALIGARIDAAGLTRRKRAHAQRTAIHAHLRAGIVAGIRVAGDRLPAERTLAEEFRANRRTVREALDLLVTEGLIERRHGSGSIVVWQRGRADAAPDFPTPAVSPLDCIEARRVIEPGYLDLVVARATDDDFALMQRRLAEMRSATDQVTFKASGYDFHLEVVRATRNPLLVAMYQMLVAARARAGWNTLIALNDSEQQREAQIEANTAIYQALRERDAAKARELSLMHLTEMLQTVLSFPAQG